MERENDGERAPGATTRTDEIPAEVLLACFPARGRRHQQLWLRRIRRWPGCPLVPKEASSKADVPWESTCVDELSTSLAWVDAMGCGQVCCIWPNERTGPFEVLYLLTTLPCDSIGAQARRCLTKWPVRKPVQAMFWAADYIFLVQESPRDSNMEVRSQEFLQTARALAKALLG